MTAGTVGNMVPTLRVSLDVETRVLWMISPLDSARRGGSEPLSRVASGVMKSEDPVAHGCRTRSRTVEAVGRPPGIASLLPA